MGYKDTGVESKIFVLQVNIHCLKLLLLGKKSSRLTPIKSSSRVVLTKKKKVKKKSSGAWMHPGKTAELSSAFLAVRPGGRSCISLSFQEKQFPPFVGLSVSLTRCICCWWGLHIAGLPINSPQTVISINTFCAFHSCDQKAV